MATAGSPGIDTYRSIGGLLEGSIQDELLEQTKAISLYGMVFEPITMPLNKGYTTYLERVVRLPPILDLKSEGVQPTSQHFEIERQSLTIYKRHALSTWTKERELHGERGAMLVARMGELMQQHILSAEMSAIKTLFASEQQSFGRGFGSDLSVALSEVNNKAADDISIAGLRHIGHRLHKNKAKKYYKQIRTTDKVGEVAVYPSYLSIVSPEIRSALWDLRDENNEKAITHPLVTVLVVLCTQTK